MGAADVLGWDADRQIVGAVVVEVGLHAPGGRGRAVGASGCGKQAAGNQDEREWDGDPSHLYHPPTY